MKVWKLLLLIAIASVLGGCVQSGAYKKTGSSANKAVPVGNSLGQKAPDFVLTDVNGKNVSLRGFEGDPVVVWFFAAWCTSCIPEARALSQVNRDFSSKGVKVVRIDVWPGETLEDLNRFMKASGTTLKDGIWAFDNGDVAVSYGVHYLDTTFVIDRGGVITYKDERPTDYSTLSREIQKVL